MTRPPAWWRVSVVLSTLTALLAASAVIVLAVGTVYSSGQTLADMGSPVLAVVVVVFGFYRWSGGRSWHC